MITIPLGVFVFFLVMGVVGMFHTTKFFCELSIGRIKLFKEKKKYLEYTIGQSDYNRKRVEQGNLGWTIGDEDLLLSTIKIFEKNGYTVEFRTNIFRRLFALGIYKVVAIKPE